MFDAERAVEVDADDANFFAVPVEIINGFLHSLADGTDSDNNAVGVGRAVIIEDVVNSAGDFGNVRHSFFDDVGQGVIIFVDGLADLEVNVWVGSGAANDGMVGIESAAAEIIYRVEVGDFRKVGVVDCFDFLNFVGSAEAVEEINEGNPAVDSGEVSDGGKVHDFLNGGFSEHSAAGLTRRHNVLVVAENVEGGSCQRAGRDVENARQEFTGDFVEIWNHEQEALRRGVGCGESAGLERAVNGTGGAAFGLQFDKAHFLTENVFGATSGHFVDIFSHRRGRGNRVNGGDLRERVGNVRSRLVAVHRLHFFSHKLSNFSSR